MVIPRVAILVTVVEYGGLDKVVLSLIKHVNRSRYQLVPIVYVRSSAGTIPFCEDLKRLGVEHHTIFVDRPRIAGISPMMNLIRTRAILKKEKIDLVNTHGYRADIIGILAARSLGLPVISTCHGYIPNDLAVRFYESLDRYILRFADRVTVVSEKISQDVASHGVDPRRIAVIRNMVEAPTDLAQLNEARTRTRQSLGIRDALLVGYVGRLNPEKGVRYLIEAISLCSAQMRSRIKVLLIGTGPEKSALERLALEYNIGPNFIFAGFQSNIMPWLAAVDIFALPSLTEGTPLALLEAMAYGMPIIASSVGGVPDIIKNDVSGILVAPGSPKAIAEALAALEADPSLRLRLGKEAAKIARSGSDMGAWAGSIEEELSKALHVGI